MKRYYVYGGLIVIISLLILGLGIAYNGYMKDNINQFGLGLSLYFISYFLAVFSRAYYRVKTEIAADYMKFDWDEFLWRYKN